MIAPYTIQKCVYILSSESKIIPKAVGTKQSTITAVNGVLPGHKTNEGFLTFLGNLAKAMNE